MVAQAYQHPHPGHLKQEDQKWGSSLGFTVRPWLKNKEGKNMKSGGKDLEEKKDYDRKNICMKKFK